MKNSIGLHLRFDTSITSVVEKACAMSLPFFQSFLVPQWKAQWTSPTKLEIRQFRKMCADNFSQLFAHGSLWINPSHTEKNTVWALQRELKLADELGFTHLIIHPGCAVGKATKKEGLYRLAQTINAVLKRPSRVQLVIENTAHGNLSVGSDIQDLIDLKKILDKPERIKFCLDTAHAYTYGYSLETENEVDCFMKFFEDEIGESALALIHLNDTRHSHGSRIDQHALLGTGEIAVPVLQRFMLHAHQQKLPLILEPPKDDEDRILASVRRAHQWDVLLKG